MRAVIQALMEMKAEADSAAASAAGVPKMQQPVQPQKSQPHVQFQDMDSDVNPWDLPTPTPRGTSDPLLLAFHNKSFDSHSVESFSDFVRPSLSASSEPVTSKTKLWIGGLDPDFDVSEIRRAVSKFGYSNVNISNPQGRAYLFVEFTGREAESNANQAFSDLRRNFNVKFKNEKVKAETPPRSPHLKPHAKASPVPTPPRSPLLPHTNSQLSHSVDPNHVQIVFSPNRSGQVRTIHSVSPPPALYAPASASPPQQCNTAVNTRPAQILYRPRQSRGGGTQLSPARAEQPVDAANSTAPHDAAAATAGNGSFVPHPSRGAFFPGRGGPPRGRGGSTANLTPDS
jgi:hypothetical protein